MKEHIERVSMNIAPYIDTFETLEQAIKMEVDGKNSLLTDMEVEWEGVVIKGEKKGIDLYDIFVMNGRPIVKHKTTKYTEKESKKKRDPVETSDALLISKDIADSLVNKARLSNVLSKLSLEEQEDVGNIIKGMIVDVTKDAHLTMEDENIVLKEDPNEKRMLHKHISKTVARFVLSER